MLRVSHDYTEATMVNRPVIRIALAILGIVFAVLWLFAVILGSAIPAWIPPSSALAIGAAVLLMLL